MAKLYYSNVTPEIIDSDSNFKHAVSYEVDSWSTVHH